MLFYVSEATPHETFLQPLFKLPDEYRMTVMSSICPPNIAKAIFIQLFQKINSAQRVIHEMQ